MKKTRREEVERERETLKEGDRKREKEKQSIFSY